MRDALPGVARRWTSGRRALALAGLIALIAAVGISALLAPADKPAPKDVAASHFTPNFLLPMGVLLPNLSLPPPALSGDRGGVGVPGATPKAPTVPNPVKVTQQGPAIVQYQGSAGTLTPVGIATLALQHGCTPNAGVIATAIAMAESGGSPSAQGDIGLMTSVWDWSAGLWQIRGLRAARNTGQLRDSVANQAVDTNAAAMDTVSQGCTNWTPWSTFNNGAYLQFMTLARQAVQYVVAFYNAHGHHYPPVAAPDPTATIPSQGTGAGPSGQSGPTGPTGTPTASPARPRRARTKPASSTPAGPPPTAPTAPARTAPVPTPTTALPTKTSPLPLPLPLPLPSPLPSRTLPLPLPTLPHLP